MWALPSSVHLAVTLRHSHDWSQALPIFFPLFRIRALYWTQTEEQKRGRPGNEASIHEYLEVELSGGAPTPAGTSMLTM